MRKILNYLVVLSLLLSIGACSKEGPEGPRGEQGEIGEQGIPGVNGNKILNGDQAPAANVGQAGDFYMNPQAGLLYGPKTSSGWGNAVNLKGANGQTGANGSTGVAGADGSQFLSGNAVPSSQGKAGDFYFATSTGVLYGPKTGSGWGNGVSLKGAKGDTGNANVMATDWLYLYDVGWSTTPDPWIRKLTSDIVNPIYGYWKPAIINSYQPGSMMLVYVQEFGSKPDTRTLPTVFNMGVASSNGLIVNGDIEIRCGFRMAQANNDESPMEGIQLVYGLKSGVWNESLMIGSAPSMVKWKLVIIPPGVVSTNQAALSKLDLGNYEVVREYFDLQN